MSILRDLIQNILNRYSEEHNEMIKMIEEENSMATLKTLLRLATV